MITGFGCRDNAVLKLCTILLYASSYRPEKSLTHYRTLQSLPLILGPSRINDAEYLDACRAKRSPVMPTGRTTSQSKIVNHQSTFDRR